jgi:RNA-dependent RNA polymerase
MSLLEERVGGRLKQGFSIGGRYFQFLAYSSSALREHAVWYVNPFCHKELGWVTAKSIRASLGDFSGVIHSPSKYAARIAQAFTATDPSVDIIRDQWEEVDDLGTEPYLFTDGVGTISPMLGDMIWEALCEARDDSYRRNIKPSAVCTSLGRTYI